MKIEGRLQKADLAYILIDIDNRTNFLHHLLPPGGDSGGSSLARRRDPLAATLAIGCNIGRQRMAHASGLSFKKSVWLPIGI